MMSCLSILTKKNQFHFSHILKLWWDLFTRPNHTFLTFSRREKILCQVLWLGARDMVAKGKLLCEARKAFLYVYYVRLLLLLEIGESYQYARVHLTWILIITSARYTFLLKRNLFIYSTYRRRKKVLDLIKVPFIQFKLELYYSMYL